jgi:hypothetical protein
VPRAQTVMHNHGHRPDADVILCGLESGPLETAEDTTDQGPAAALESMCMTSRPGLLAPGQGQRQAQFWD